MSHFTLHASIGLGALGIALTFGCGGTSDTTSSATTSSSESALSSAYASAIDSSGTLLCSPTQTQLDACTGISVGEACTLATKDSQNSLTGTCRTTIDGSAVACAPNPPAPPKELVDACSSKAAGDECTTTEAFGNTFTGACVMARDEATLICGRIHEPPQEAIDACSTKSAGDTCSMPSRDDRPAANGICSLGPASTGPLACAPARELLPPGADACDGLAIGDSCMIGPKEHSISGTCMTPAIGGNAICVVACGQVNDIKPGPGGHDRLPDGHDHWAPNGEPPPKN